MTDRVDQYQQIVFLDGDGADEAFDFMTRIGCEAAINYLLQWDTGDGAILPESSHGEADNHYTSQQGHLLLSWNRSLWYIGLQRVIPYGVGSVARAELYQQYRAARERGHALLIEYQSPIMVAAAWLHGTLRDEDRSAVGVVCDQAALAAGRDWVEGHGGSCVHRRLIWSGLVTPSGRNATDPLAVPNGNMRGTADAVAADIAREEQEARDLSVVLAARNGLISGAEALRQLGVPLIRRGGLAAVGQLPAQAGQHPLDLRAGEEPFNTAGIGRMLDALRDHTDAAMGVPPNVIDNMRREIQLDLDVDIIRAFNAAQCTENVDDITVEIIPVEPPPKRRGRRLQF